MVAYYLLCYLVNSVVYKNLIDDWQIKHPIRSCNYLIVYSYSNHMLTYGFVCPQMYFTAKQGKKMVKTTIFFLKDT